MGDFVKEQARLLVLYTEVASDIYVISSGSEIDDEENNDLEEFVKIMK